MSSNGIDVDVPNGWDGEIYGRTEGLTSQGSGGGRTNSVLHLGNFPIPAERGDYGSGAVEIMKAENVFIALFEFGPESVGTRLFAKQGIPTVDPADFEPAAMQRPLPGQSGVQYFFTEAGRAFCLYVALGAHARRNEVVPEVNSVLSTLSLT